jgi:phosphoenolpyruvate carboxykinase (GTP)
MLLPPEGLKMKGYRIWTVGDDIAWMKVDTDGRLWAVNPEMGYFGVVPGTNSKTNFNAMATIKHDTIYTNVALKPDGTVWWEGHDEPPPAEALDWQGKAWNPKTVGKDGKPVMAAHPNSRFTAPFTNCPTHSFRFEHHHGVPISAIIFGGRRATLAPLVYEALNWEHGVYMGASMASERTAAQFGAVGEVRRDPMAMLPFCGYNMADYFGHWLDMGTRISRPPKIFHVNWFRTDEKGKFLWPGFGENLRILEWILARYRNDVGGVETPIGIVPNPKDIDMTGLDLPAETMTQLLAIHPKDWLAEIDAVGQFFETFGTRMPEELWQQNESLRRRVLAAGK